MQANTSFDLSNFIGKLSSPESVQERKKQRKAKVTERKGKSTCNLAISEGKNATLELRSFEYRNNKLPCKCHFTMTEFPQLGIVYI